MQCPHCQHAHRPEAKFCEECGARLRAACPACGQEVAPTARFCPECGTGLAGPRPSVAPLEQVAPPRPPAAYTPRHLAERILAEQAALEVKNPAASGGAFRADGHYADIARFASTCPSAVSLRD